MILHKHHLTLFLFTEDKAVLADEPAIPEHPEVMVCAAYCGPPTYPVRISVLREMVSSD